METGLLGELLTAEDLLRIVRELRRRGYSALDAFAPYSIPGLQEALGLARSPLPWVVFPLAMLGVVFAYLVQWYTVAYDYPLNVGGRPAHAAAAFVPIVFETMVLFAALTTFFGVFVLSHLPRLHHPLFHVEGFERASIDRFWVGVDEGDPLYERERTERELASLGARRVAYAGERP